jgi:hypothetical protein
MFYRGGFMLLRLFCQKNEVSMRLTGMNGAGAVSWGVTSQRLVRSKKSAGVKKIDSNKNRQVFLGSVWCIIYGVQHNVAVVAAVTV